MFCTKCGANIADGLKFCTECGAVISTASASSSAATPASDTGAASAATANATMANAQSSNAQPANQQQGFQQQGFQQQGYQQPGYQPQPPVYQQPVYQQVVNTAPKKKRHVGLYVLLSILIVLAGVIVYFLGSFSFFKPKDLGVKYTQADTNSVMQKLGIHVTADLGNGQKYDNAPMLTGDLTAKANSTLSSKTLGTKLSYKDYNWAFSNYQPKKVTLTPAEVTAFFNEIAPTFWWFDNTQVKIDSDGSIITSSKANIKKIKEEIYPDIAGEIPIPLPDSVNLYTKGDFSITNNKINMVPEEIKAGPIKVPEQYLGGSNLNVFSEYLDRFITIIPGLQINSAGAKDGGFVFDGTIPTEVSITPKN